MKRGFSLGSAPLRYKEHRMMSAGRFIPNPHCNIQSGSTPMKTLRSVLAVAVLAAAALASSAEAKPTLNLEASKLIRPAHCLPYIIKKVTHLGRLWHSHWDRIDIYKNVRIGHFCVKIKIKTYYQYHRVPHFPYHSAKAA